MSPPNALTNCTDATVIQFRKPDLNVILIRNTTINQPTRETYDQTAINSILGRRGLHQEGDYTHAPTVNHIPVAVFITIGEFRGKICLCATDSLYFPVYISQLSAMIESRRITYLKQSVAMILFRKSEIRNLDDRVNIPLNGGHQYVFWFEISMRNAMFMDILSNVLDGVCI